jgi:hypothetical protein
MTDQWYVQERFARVSGTDRVYEVVRDSVVYDTFEDRKIADAVVNYRNRHMREDVTEL